MEEHLIHILLFVTRLFARVLADAKEGCKKGSRDGIPRAR